MCLHEAQDFQGFGLKTIFVFHHGTPAAGSTRTHPQGCVLVLGQHRTQNVTKCGDKQGAVTTTRDKCFAAESSLMGYTKTFQSM